MRYTAHDYQRVAADWIRDRPYAGLLLDMGLGKTVVTLTVIDYLLYDRLIYDKVLVIAPLMVAADTWGREIDKWAHLKHLRLSKVLGSAAKRRAALEVEADIYIVNRENVVWLVERYGSKWPFDFVVIDELSSFKNIKSKRFRALRKVRPLISRLVGLTGTPMPNGYMDLWSQVYLLDRGERLGKTITAYRHRFFQASYRPWGDVYELRPGAEAAINQLIQDICLSMKAADYLPLEEPLVIDIPVSMTDKERAKYEQMERDSILELTDGGLITAANAAAVTNKLLQLASGFAYDADKKAQEIHSRKLEHLAELVEAANGRPVLVCYSFIHDKDRILQRLKGQGVKTLDGPAEIAAWNKGEIPVLLVHPASCGHGLNLQDGGNILIWYGLPWSLELYQQAIARLLRQGQANRVVVYRLITEGTMDEDVAARLAGKYQTQDEFLARLSAKLRQRLKEAG